jgi:hypothetical protein
MDIEQGGAMLIPGFPNIPASRFIGATGHAVLAATWIVLGLVHWRHYVAGNTTMLLLAVVAAMAAASHILRALFTSASAHPLDCCLASLGVASICLS